MTKTDNKLTLVEINFSIKNYNSLLKRALDLVSIWMLKDLFQKLEIYTCDAFQLFFPPKYIWSFRR